MLANAFEFGEVTPGHGRTPPADIKPTGGCHSYAVGVA